MATANRWMDVDTLLDRMTSGHGSDMRNAHSLLVEAEKLIEKAAVAVSYVAMALEDRRLAGAALSAETPNQLRDALKAVLLQLPQRVPR